MSKKIKHTLLPLIATIMVTALTLTSCYDDDGPYNSGLLGTWELTGVTYYNTNQFTFYGNGSGVYGAYDGYGNWQQWGMTYDVYGSQLTVYLNTGQVWRYTWAITGNTLILNDLDYAGNTLYYQYVY